MSLNTLSLALTALAYGGFGAWLLVSPSSMEAVGLALTTPAGYTEIRAFYGGLELGCAAFFVLAALRPGWHIPGLVLQATSLGGAALGRVAGLVIDGTRDGLVYGLLAAEAFAAVVALALLWRTVRTDA